MELSWTPTTPTITSSCLNLSTSASSEVLMASVTLDGIHKTTSRWSARLPVPPVLKIWTKDYMVMYVSFSRSRNLKKYLVLTVLLYSSKTPNKPYTCADCICGINLWPISSYIKLIHIRYIGVVALKSDIKFYWYRYISIVVHFECEDSVYSAYNKVFSMESVWL